MIIRYYKIEKGIIYKRELVIFIKRDVRGFKRC